MSWKRVIVASGTGGAIQPVDLTATNLSENATDEGKVLKIKADGSSMGWYPDETIAHPTGFPQTGITLTSTSPTAGPSLANDGVVISELDIDIATDSDGHTTTATGTIKTREMSLADLGYVGAHDANNFIHPENGPTTPTKNLNIGSLASNEVITGITYSRTTDKWGHTQEHDAGYSTKQLDLSDLGYTGHADADNYDYWTVANDNSDPENITAGGTLKFTAGAHMEVTTTENAGTVTVEVTGVPKALGEITTITEGDGLAFTLPGGAAATHFDGDAPSGVISLEEPETIEVGSSNSSGSNGVGHTHAITTTSDGHANNDTILAVDANGYIKVSTLEVANSFTVNGAEVILGSADLQIEDNTIQINYNSTDGDFNDEDSAIIFGTDYDANGRTNSTKIVNKRDLNGATHSGLVFTDLMSAGDATVGNGTTDVGGNVKGLYTGPILAKGSVFCENIKTAGYVWSGEALLTDSYLQFTEQSTAPVGESGAEEDGMVYWSGDDLWVYYA